MSLRATAERAAVLRRRCPPAPVGIIAGLLLLAAIAGAAVLPADAAALVAPGTGVPSAYAAPGDVQPSWYSDMPERRREVVREFVRSLNPEYRDQLRTQPYEWAKDEGLRLAEGVENVNAASNPRSTAFERTLGNAAREAKVFPSIADVSLPAGAATLAARATDVGYAFWIGWQIGTGARKLYIRLFGPQEPDTTASYYDFKWVYNGAPYQTWGGYVPAHSWHLTWTYQAFPSGPQVFGERSLTATSGPCAVPAPMGSHEIVNTGVYDTCGHPPSAVEYVSLDNLWVGDAQETAPPGWSSALHVTSSWPAPPGDAAIDSAVEAIGESADGSSLRSVVDWAAQTYPEPVDGDTPATNGGDFPSGSQTPNLDPTQDGGPLGTVQVPQGIGTPQADYLAELDRLYLHVDEIDEAGGFNWDFDPDDVLYIDPAPGTVVESGSGLRITVNPTTVVVPHPRPDETAEEYADDALHAGFEPVIEANPDPTAPDGAITGPITPSPGTSAEPGTEVEIAAQPPAYSRPPDSRCETYVDAPDFDGAVKKRYLPNHPMEELSAPSEPGGTVPLRYGVAYPEQAIDRKTGDLFTNYPKWGWSHIKAKHGWGSWSRAWTLAALASRWSLTSNGRHLYTVGYDGQDGTDCQFRVVVAPADTGDEYFPGPVGIITAYGGPAPP
jgi:hypothetical protein